MERKENNQLKKSSLILMTIAGISLFMMLAFFSYSMFGGGKGTYSSTCSGIVDTDGICTPLASYTLTIKVNNGKFKVNGTGSVLNTTISDKTEIVLTSDNALVECDAESCSSSIFSILSATKEGNSYQFNGWGTSSSCTSGTTSTITYSSDVTYYACWEPKEGCYSVQYNGNTRKYWATTKSDAISHFTSICGTCGNSAVFNPDINQASCIDVYGGSSSSEEGCYVVQHNGNTYKYWATTKSNAISHFTSVCGTCGSSAVLNPDINETACQGVSGSCTYKIEGGTGGTVDTSKSKCNGTVNYSGRIYLSTLEECVSNTGKCISDWNVKFKDGTTGTYSSWIDSTENNGKDCGITLTPNWGSCGGSGSGGGNGSGGGTGNVPTPSSSSSSSSPKPSSASSSSDAEYEKLNPAYDRCYNNKWVRVVSCQPDGTGAKCKLSTGETVDKATIKKAKTTGCDVPGDAFDASIAEGDRCNMATGKLVYIVSCQPFDDVIGAHCKDNKGNYVFMGNLAAKENSACKNDKPSTDNSDDPANQDVDKSVQTGTTAFVLSWIAGIIALVISFYYFRKNYFVKQ